ncbi:MAG: hypothetical protein BRC41_05400 [Cyanobacteria bacterium QH_9_48_43]|nr:MAG: hypothetical protein BRC41_05400 [Cyanobacteria bacterium QH_9_48_43]
MRLSSFLPTTVASAVVFSAIAAPPALSQFQDPATSTSVIAQVSAEELVNRGREKLAQQDYQEAIENLTQAVRNNPELATAYYNRSSAYLELGEYQKVIEDTTQALQINSNLADAYLNRSNRSAARLELGEYQKAIEDASQALQINPNLGLAYYNRGISHYKLGNEQAGDEDLEKAGEIFLYQAGSQVAQSLIRELLQ